jgi:uncharacterized membrane protein
MTLGHLILRYAHITCGLLALGAAAGAMVYPKGSTLHRQHGNLFVIAMVVMSLTGLYISLFITPVYANIMGGSMAFYLTVTAWLAAWRKPEETGRLEIAAMIWGFAVAAVGVTFGVLALDSPNRMLQGFPHVGYFVFATAALAGALLDFRMINRGGFTGSARTARHLSRMCFAMFMATGSFFLGQAKLFPAEVRQSGVLLIPAFLPFALLIYWMIRIRLWPSIRKGWALRSVPRVSRT